MRTLIIETTLYVLLCLVVYFAEPQASELLAYYHTGIKQFELWRLLTATFCHTNFNHLALNLTSLLITLNLFINVFKGKRLFPLILFNSLFISLALFFFESDVMWYVGFSGVLHGLFSYAVISELYKKDKWGIILGVGLVIKITYEQFFGAQQNTIELIGAPVLVNAHLYGAIAGIIYYVLTLWGKNRKR